MINKITNFDKKRAFKEAFETLVEKIYLDSVIRATDFETIIQVFH
jgi:hypothetical protein